jgi:hypothetical protein
MDVDKPFDSFKIEKHAGEYKDFGLPAASSYPLKGVTYPVDYGEVEGFVGEDGALLDVFMGKDGNVMGYFVVQRPELEEGEHKFYVNLTEEEETAVLEQFQPVIIEQGRFDTYDDLLQAIEPFRHK